MKQLICEMCGSTDLTKQDGVFVCQTCGCKYSVEEAKKMMVEGTVDVTGSTVKVDNSQELDNLYLLARRAKADYNAENALKYYTMILVKDPNNWEPIFYQALFSAVSGSYQESDIVRSFEIVDECFDIVISNVKNNISSKDEQDRVMTEITDAVEKFASSYYETVDEVYHSGPVASRIDFVTTYLSVSSAVIDLLNKLGDTIELYFENDNKIIQLSVELWKNAINKISKREIKNMLESQSSKQDVKNIIQQIEIKIKKYDNSYNVESNSIPEQSSGGCYVATAVYGSYDCPEVWTLRRYRDNQLAQTWYGRLFIHTYYAISPTIVKWFGDTEWFKRMWKGKLDKMVSDLQSKGVESTPYEDRNW